MARRSLDDIDFWMSSSLTVCFDHSHSYELDHFDTNFHLIFWLKVINDTVFEASVMQFDIYEHPPPP